MEKNDKPLVANSARSTTKFDEWKGDSLFPKKTRRGKYYLEFSMKSLNQRTQDVDWSDVCIRTPQWQNLVLDRTHM